MSLNLFFIILTVGVSILAFRNQELFDKLKFNAYMVFHQKEWYRLFSYGLIHSNRDLFHLIINMFVLYSFGGLVEGYFEKFSEIGLLGWHHKIYYGALYVLAIPISTIASLIKHKHDHSYNAVGASGAVSAVVFASILFDPASPVYIFFIPIPIPGIIFALIYLGYSHYMSKKNIDNIGHDAHFWGAVFGFVFPLLLNPDFLQLFIQGIRFW